MGGVMFLSLLVNLPRLSFSQILVSALYPLRFLIYASLYFIVKNLPEADKKFLRIGFVISILAVAVIGLGQYILMPDVSFLKAAAWDDHFYRLVMPFFDPGFTGAVLVLGLLAIYNLQFTIYNYTKIFIMAIVFVALMLTYSRASYLMYLVSFAVVSWYKKTLNIFLVALIIFLIALPLLPKSSGEGTKLERENSILARVNNWKESVAIWQTKPLLGVGYNAYRYSRDEINTDSHSGAGADSSILLVLATTGVVGLLAYLYLFKTLILLNQKSVIVIASFVGIFIHSWFNNTLFYPWVMEWLWILIALY
jgi:O-antigen ligase